MDITEQLVQIYKDEVRPYGTLTELEARRYYNKMVAHGRIHLYMDSSYIAGFIESWRLDYEQLGRVVCWSDFNALEEDVTNGDIAYISDIWIRDYKRGTGVTKILIDMFKNANRDAEYYVSRRHKNKVKYIRVYDKLTGYKHKE